MSIKNDIHTDQDFYKFGQYSPCAALGFIVYPAVKQVKSMVDTFRLKSLRLEQRKHCERCDRLIDDVN